MKTALLLTGALFISAPVFAQPQQPSGYELLTQAGEKILPGPNGGASNSDPKISPEENLKRERLAVARNAPALALVRLALQKPITIPEAEAGEAVPFNAKVRELARQFSQESDVRFADGDSLGAMNSRLDAMELGADIGHGGLIAMLVGIAVEAIASKDAERIGASLDAAQCRQAIGRLNTIEGRRTTLTETLRHEQQSNLQFMLANFAVPTEVSDLKPGENGASPTVEEIAQFKALTPAKLTENNTRLFDAAIAATQSPYSTALTTKLPQDLSAINGPVLNLLQEQHYRFSYERLVAQTRLLRCALKLRAQKLDRGSYPKDLVPPMDPFSPTGKPLIYRKLGDDYLLYSVGPDGVDDGGAEIQTVQISEATGIKSVSHRLQPESTGDIVQAPF